MVSVRTVNANNEIKGICDSLDKDTEGDLPCEDSLKAIRLAKNSWGDSPRCKCNNKRDSRRFTLIKILQAIRLAKIHLKQFALIKILQAIRLAKIHSRRFTLIKILQAILLAMIQPRKFALIKILKAICQFRLAKIHSRRFAMPKIAEAFRQTIHIIVRYIQGDSLWWILLRRFALLRFT